MRRGPRISKPVIHDTVGFFGMRVAGQVTKACMDEVEKLIVPGVTTQQIDDAVRKFCTEHNVRSATKDYQGFPAHCCTSVNHVVAHGIPNNRWLQIGDVLKLDIALNVNGWHGDMCRTYLVGGSPCGSVKANLLMYATEHALASAVSKVKPGATLGDIGHAIGVTADAFSYTAVREFGGHGIGRIFHDVPEVLNYGNPGEGLVLEPGMFFTIEPMLNVGERHVKLLKDGSIVTRDRSLSAQFEHTVGVTATGCEVFTA